jgi:hypothetical protein
VDPSTLGKKALQIASNLVQRLPEVAIELVERSAQALPGENKLDWAYVSLSLEATKAVTDKGFKIQSDAAEAIRSRIKDPKASATALFAKRCSADEIIEDAERLQKNGDRIFLIQHWIKVNKHQSDVARAIRYALDLIIRTTAYTPTARTLRDLAFPLPLLGASDEARKLISEFDIQKETVRHTGPTDDFFDLQLLIAESESHFSADLAADRLVNLYLDIEQVTDLTQRFKYTAKLYSSLHRIDPQRRLEESEGIQTLTLAELEKALERVLASSADQLNATIGAIGALSMSEPSLALRIAQSLNTVLRRESATLQLINDITSEKLQEKDLPTINKALHSLSAQRSRENAALSVIESLTLAEAPKSIQSESRQILGLINSIADPESRCRACCLALNWLINSTHTSDTGLRERLTNLLISSWTSIDADWERVETGYRIARLLAPSLPEDAQKYLDLTEEFRRQVLFESSDPANIFTIALELAIRSLSGLFPKHLDREQDTENIMLLIDRLPSTSSRLNMLSYLALNLFKNNRTTECQQIVNRRIRPELQTLKSKDLHTYRQSLRALVVVLYCSHRSTTIEEIIKQLDNPERDQALYSIADYILRGCLGSPERRAKMPLWDILAI